MTDNHVDGAGRLPQQVFDAVEAFVDQLHGRNNDFDLDDLDDDTFETVSILLPLVAEAVLTGGQVSLDDVPGWEDSTALAELGLLPEAGKVRLNGAAVRRHREAANLTTREAATILSGRGYTVTSDFFDAVEARPGTSVAPQIGELVAATLGVDVDHVTFDDTVNAPPPVASSDSADAPDELAAVERRPAAADPEADADADDSIIGSVTDEIFWVRPDVTITTAAAPAGALGALALTRLGLVTKAVIFDVTGPGASEREILDAAEAILVTEPETAMVFAIRADEERSTQMIDPTDLARAVVTTTGRRLQRPRRPVLALGDAVRSAFEELLPVWDDIDVAGPAATSIDAQEVASSAAHDAIDAIIKGRVVIEAKKEAVRRVGSRHHELGVDLGSLVAAVRSGAMSPQSVPSAVKELAEAS